jgi:hypothetical protein
MVLELELLGAKILIFLVAEVSEKFVRGKLSLVKFVDDYRTLFHFA